MKRSPSTLAAGLVAAALLLSSSFTPALADPFQATDVAKRKVTTTNVRLIVDFGDGVEKHFSRIAWRDKMTVQDVTLAAVAHPRGIQIKQRGKQATAFLSKIDDLANQPGGKSWVYRVNGKLADRSFGIYPVKRGDVVTWSFQKYSP